MVAGLTDSVAVNRDKQPVTFGEPPGRISHACDSQTRSGLLRLRSRIPVCGIAPAFKTGASTGESRVRLTKGRYGPGRFQCTHYGLSINNPIAEAALQLSGGTHRASILLLTLSDANYIRRCCLPDYEAKSSTSPAPSQVICTRAKKSFPATWCPSSFSCPSGRALALRPLCLLLPALC